MIQQEENLVGQDALVKVRAIVDEIRNCFLCTDIRTGIPMSVRPMHILEVDDAGYLWFMTSSTTHKDDEIKENPFVHVLLQNGKELTFLNLYGIAEVKHDTEKIHELWKDQFDSWFEGPEDPQIILLRVEVLEGHYWDRKLYAPTPIKALKSLIQGSKDEEDIHGDIMI
ncbi:pyridoxamine 5'-phosphate oxidase family protein [Sphingobacterium sp. LRF_L2]|uniref:pyridoxamine 5'-phosphate oxidase family protein n=1 Tax=Sphingobacterium sp. LRF_L2 TaxID=3369421 RepID=UPI003F62B40B